MVLQVQLSGPTRGSELCTLLCEIVKLYAFQRNQIPSSAYQVIQKMICEQPKKDKKEADAAEPVCSLTEGVNRFIKEVNTLIRGIRFLYSSELPVLKVLVVFNKNRFSNLEAHCLKLPVPEILEDDSLPDPPFDVRDAHGQILRLMNEVFAGFENLEQCTINIYVCSPVAVSAEVCGKEFTDNMFLDFEAVTKDNSLWERLERTKRTSLTIVPYHEFPVCSQDDGNDGPVFEKGDNWFRCRTRIRGFTL